VHALKTNTFTILKRKKETTEKTFSIVYNGAVGQHIFSFFDENRKLLPTSLHCFIQESSTMEQKSHNYVNKHGWGNNCVNTKERVMVLSICTVHQLSTNQELNQYLK
jgi:hypothetical protein